MEGYMVKPFNVCHLRIDPPDLPLAARLAGFDSLAQLSRAITRAGNIDISPASLSYWSREIHAPSLPAWRIIEDFISARGVTARDIADEKRRLAK
jgi:hypothetical protein